VEQINLSILSSDDSVIRHLRSLQKKNNVFTICGQYEKYSNIPLNEHPKPALFFIDDSTKSQSGLFNFLKVFSKYYSDTKTIVYTENLDGSFLKTLLSYDVRGILNKTETPVLHLKNKFFETVRLVNSGSCCFDNVVRVTIKGLIWAKGETENPASYTLYNNVNDEAIINAVKLLNLLSPKEREILILIAGGNQNKKISEILCIDVGTVKQHKNHIIKKLKLKSTDELIRFTVLYGNEIFKLK